MPSSKGKRDSTQAQKDSELRLLRFIEQGEGGEEDLRWKLAAVGVLRGTRAAAKLRDRRQTKAARVSQLFMFEGPWDASGGGESGL